MTHGDNVGTNPQHKSANVNSVEINTNTFLIVIPCSADAPADPNGMETLFQSSSLALSSDSGVLSKPVPIPGVGGDTSYLPKTCQDNWMKSTEF